MRKKMAFVLAFFVLFAAFLPCAAAETPAVPRVYRTEMRASVAYRGGEKYIALDVVINDITEPTGLLGIDFNISFDGDALIPLWQTKEELNGNGKNADTLNPPQMITKWPIHTLDVAGKKMDFAAAEGLCKSYETTGKGLLNVDLILTADKYSSPVFGDGEMAVRLYFKPTGGFKAGRTYCFSIDGQYGETIRQYILVRGVNGERMPGNAYGYGAEASYTVTWADCGAFDLTDTGVGLVPDGEKGVLWTDGIYAAGDLKLCFKNKVRVLDAAGKAVSDTGQVLPGFSAETDDGTLKIAVRGDINCDGIVSVADCALLKSALRGKTELKALQSAIADLSRDNRLTTTDALQLKRLLKGAF